MICGVCGHNLVKLDLTSYNLTGYSACFNTACSMVRVPVNKHGIENREILAEDGMIGGQVSWTSHELNKIATNVSIANHRWWVDPATGQPIKRNVGEMLMLCTSELAEALEGDRKNLMDDKLPHRRMFDVEIVDTFIRLFDIAGHLIPEFGEIFEEKMEYNRTRKDHTNEHRLGEGGKKY